MTEYKVKFGASVNEEIHVAVIEYIGQHSLEIKEGKYRTIVTELMTFCVERAENRFEIDFASWNDDMLYIQVS